MSYKHALHTIPDGMTLSSVTATSEYAAGRKALCISLTDAITLNGKPHVDYVDMPTFAVLPVTFLNGCISVDILSRLNSHAPDYARAFAGLAYRISENNESFEFVYLRPLNGVSLDPPPPRNKRAVQYFAYPDWRYERLRETYPDGRCEAAADILPNTWINLRLDINAQAIDVFVDHHLVMKISEPKAIPQFGKVGLFVDIGTEAFFSNLEITPL